MKIKVLIIVMISIFLLLSEIGVAKTVNINNEDGIKQVEKTIIRDVAYGDSARHKMDVFLPDDRTELTKAVLLIPGGGWIGGDKSGFEYHANVFADSSIVAFTMNYRYASVEDGVTYVEMLADIDSAISFIISKSDEYIFNPEQICLYGHSAGAHLALLYAYRNNDSRVSNVVSLAGPSDLRDPVMLSLPTGILTILYSVVPTMDICKWQDASPINHVSTITTYLYHGTKDNIIPYQQSEVFFDKIKEVNPKNKLEIIQGGEHGFSLSDNLRTINETVALIKGN